MFSKLPKLFSSFFSQSNDLYSSFFLFLLRSPISRFGSAKIVFIFNPARIFKKNRDVLNVDCKNPDDRNKMLLWQRQESCSICFSKNLFRSTLYQFKAHATKISNEIEGISKDENYVVDIKKLNAKEYI